MSFASANTLLPTNTLDERGGPAIVRSLLVDAPTIAQGLNQRASRSWGATPEKMAFLQRNDTVHKHSERFERCVLIPTAPPQPSEAIVPRRILSSVICAFRLSKSPYGRIFQNSLLTLLLCRIFKECAPSSGDGAPGGTNSFTYIHERLDTLNTRIISCREKKETGFHGEAFVCVSLCK